MSNAKWVVIAVAAFLVGCASQEPRVQQGAEAEGY